MSRVVSEVGLPEVLGSPRHGTSWMRGFLGMSAQKMGCPGCEVSKAWGMLDWGVWRFRVGCMKRGAPGSRAQGVRGVSTNLRKVGHAEPRRDCARVWTSWFPEPRCWRGLHCGCAAKGLRARVPRLFRAPTVS